MFGLNKRILNFLVIIVLSFITFGWTFWVSHREFQLKVVIIVIIVRILASLLIFRDSSLSWSRASQKTFLIKAFVNLIAFVFYMPIFYKKIEIAFFVSELFTYIFAINLMMYIYYYYRNKSGIVKTKNVVIYGAGRAGLMLNEEFKNSECKVNFFIDDDEVLQGRSIDAVKIISREHFKNKYTNKKFDLLAIAMPSAPSENIKTIYNELYDYFENIRILPGLENILINEPFLRQLKDISIEDLLARRPKDLDIDVISEFIKGKKILVTGAGGSIGSEICRLCKKFEAKQIILLDHSEYNLYKITEELNGYNISSVLQSVVNKEQLEKTFIKYKPDLVIHAAAYKHVPLVEENMCEAVINNVKGTKNVVDLSIKYQVKKLVLISTDKAVRPTNVMGATKRVSELYGQNSNGLGTEIVAVRFGNVLGSSGSVIPKFREQIEKGGPVTVTHPEVTRYFMLIKEACELVLQAGALGKGGEIFILDMGEPVKIADLAKKMIELSGNLDIEIKFTGLRPGEKLYEELLINDADRKTKYDSIFVAKPTNYDLEKLKRDIEELFDCKDLVKKLKNIVEEFNHALND